MDKKIRNFLPIREEKKNVFGGNLAQWMLEFLGKIDNQKYQLKK